MQVRGEAPWGNPAGKARKRERALARAGKSGEHSVSWEDCQLFIAKLNAASVAQKAKIVFRLPTDEEWNHAYTGGTEANIADEMASSAETGWVGTLGRRDDKDDVGSHPVGQKKPNAFGLYDMAGNISEWTEDAALGKWFEEASSISKPGYKHLKPCHTASVAQQ